MTSEQYDKMNELARRMRELGYTKVKCDVALTDDYFTVTDFKPSEGFVTISKSDGDFLDDFPISSLSADIIIKVLWEAERAISNEEDAVNKVLDNNYHASL